MAAMRSIVHSTALALHCGSWQTSPKDPYTVDQLNLLFFSLRRKVTAQDGDHGKNYQQKSMN